MMRFLQRIALTLPALRRVVDQRDRLLNDTSALRHENAVLQERMSNLPAAPRALLEEISVLRHALHGPLQGVSGEQLTAIGYAFQDHRMILTDYPYYPHERQLANAAAGRILAERFEAEELGYAETLRGIARHIEGLSRIPRDATEKLAPLWDNPWFPPFDGATLYGLIAETRPGRYIEVGSGISTRFARQAIIDLELSTKIISIDPHPHNPVEGLCDEIIVSRMEDMPGAFWEGLSPSDMLFIDNSHRSFPASDVTVFFSEVMPALPAGILYGMHDIFLPNDYPDAWKERFYNEQYLLMTYLLGGAGTDSIVLPVNWSIGRKELFAILQPLFDQERLFAGTNIAGGCFWLRRGGAV